MELLFSLNNIGWAAQQFWNSVGDCRVFAFHGSLGAGKTTFITALCHAKGVVEDPSSPTFSIINEYLLRQESAGKEGAFHMDLYRVNDEEEAVQAGVDDSLYSRKYCFVEWPEKIPNLLPEDTLHVYLSLAEEGRRVEWDF